MAVLHLEKAYYTTWRNDLTLKLHMIQKSQNFYPKNIIKRPSSRRNYVLYKTPKTDLHLCGYTAVFTVSRRDAMTRKDINKHLQLIKNYVEKRKI